MVNFAAIANKKVADIERPPNMPIGTYLAVVTNIPAQGEVAGGKWETLDFMLRIIKPMEDVDPDALKAYSAKAGDVNKRIMQRRFMFSTEDDDKFHASEYQVKSFCFKHLMVDESLAMSGSEMLHESVNHQCLVSVKWEPDKNDPEIIYDRIGKTAPVE